MSLEMKKGVDLNTMTVTELETVTEENTAGAIPEETNTEESVAATTDSQNVSEVKSTETETTSVKADESASDSISAEGDKKEVIDLSDGEAENKKALDPPKTKVKNIDYDIFVPKIKLLKSKSVDSFSDEEIIALALNKLTCDSFLPIMGCGNIPVTPIWNHLYDVVGDGDIKLAKAICNLNKNFPGAVKYMWDQIKKTGSGGYWHTVVFELVEKYYFTKDKPKKNTKKEGSKPVKVSDSPAKPAVPKKEKAAKPVKEKKETKKVEKDEPLQLSLLSLL